MVTAWWSDVPGTNVPVHAHTFPETRWVSRAICGSRPARRRSTSGLETGSTCPRTCRYDRSARISAAIYVSGMPGTA